MEKKSPYKPGGMFEGASPILFDYAKQLRKTMTAAEMLLWGHLKKGIEGYKFRRQHPLASYIADLYCHKLRLIIEVDGNIHDKLEVREYDLLREQELKQLGYSIIRFTNEEVLNNVQSVIQKIEVIIKDDSAKQIKNK